MSSFVVHRGYTSNHKGVDGHYPDAQIPPFVPIKRLLFSGKTHGFDQNGKRHDDWAVIWEGSDRHVFWTFHLQANSLPKAVNEINLRGYIAKHVIGHEYWKTHTHIGACIVPQGKSFHSVSQAEQNGWTVDPTPYIMNGMATPSWVSYIRDNPDASVDEYAGRPKADWDLKRDIDRVLIHDEPSGEFGEKTRKEIVKNGLNFKQEIENHLHDSRFLDWYLQDPWVLEQLKKRGIIKDDAQIKKFIKELEVLTARYKKG